MESLGSVMFAHQMSTNISFRVRSAGTRDFSDTYKTTRDSFATHRLGDFEFYVGGFFNRTFKRKIKSGRFDEYDI